MIASCGTTTAHRLHAAAYFVASLLPHATLLLQLLVAGRVSLQAGGSGAASTLPAAAGLKLDLQHARLGLGGRSQGAKPSTILPSLLPPSLLLGQGGTSVRAWQGRHRTGPWPSPSPPTSSTRHGRSRRARPTAYRDRRLRASCRRGCTPPKCTRPACLPCSPRIRDLSTNTLKLFPCLI